MTTARFKERIRHLLAAGMLVAFAAHGADEAQVPFAPTEAMRLAERVADHQLAMAADDPAKYPFDDEAWERSGWIQGALFVGLRELADHSSNPKYGQAILARGKANGWQLGPLPYHADDHAIGQSYLWAAAHGAGAEALAPMKARFDHILAKPPTTGLQHHEAGRPDIPNCNKRWCWCDALFMAPAAWLELSKVTGDPRYADYAQKEFAATTALLFDAKEGLYYRDSRFIGRRGPQGEKIFWSRGNGWVHAGLARMIPLLPRDDPSRTEMEKVFKAMSARLIEVQKPDGYWSPSLLGDPNKSRPESSGTAFFTYGLAWGIRNGLLDRETYEPAVRKGWAALARAVHPDGRIGYVQPVGDRPDNVAYDDTHFYGGGAFILAATAVADLKLDPGPDPTRAADLTRPQAVLNVRTAEPGKQPAYQRRDRYAVPADHKIGDDMIAFEGLGWESGPAAYRLYLDERLAVDLFGKKSPENVLQSIGTGGASYHEMSSWGMDIFKVGNTVGLGGLGRLRGGKAVQLGKSAINVEVDNRDIHEARAEVRSTGLDEGKTGLVIRLGIRDGSALTRVSAQATPPSAEPFVTGLVKHAGVQVLQGEADATGWSYVATWGKQSLAGDDLGMAVFFRPGDVVGGVVDDGSTLYVTFKDPARIRYAFGFAWAQDPQGVRTIDQFRDWVQKRRLELLVP